MDAGDVAQIASALFTALAALAALLTVRQARNETQISRAALDADTQPLITDVPRGVFIEEVEWHNRATDLPAPFSYAVGDRWETWEEGLVIAHNPRARLPLPDDAFPASSTR